MLTRKLFVRVHSNAMRLRQNSGILLTVLARRVVVVAEVVSAHRAVVSSTATRPSGHRTMF